MMDFNPPEWSHDKNKVVIDHNEYSLDRYGEYNLCGWSRYGLLMQSLGNEMVAF